MIPVICPLHPRTRARIESDDAMRARFGSGRAGGEQRFRFIEPLGYLDFLALMDSARLVLTDSGGIQEETTALGVPCLTLRDNTERPVTISEGTNQLLGSDPRAIAPAVRKLLAEEKTPRDGSLRERAIRVPELWDGHAAERMADALIAFCAARAVRG
jgi:UDP-N-acetylglucosamine 2-epimerase (non-hydrolysing)